MNLRDPLARARGLGSAKDGVAHWWLQRLSAVALLPLSVWFFWAAAPLLRADGLLFAGHSESLFHTADLFHLRGKTVYELTRRAAAPAKE